MKKILYSQFNTVGNVMDTVLSGINLRGGMKKNTLYKFWSKIVGKKFEELTKPVNINDAGILTIACANSFVTSELSMFKPDLLNKVNQYANPLGLEVSDINFSHKIWKTAKPGTEIEKAAREFDPVGRPLPDFNEEDFDLDEAEIEAIKQSVQANSFAPQEQRDRMFAAIVRDLKYQKFLASVK